MTRSKNRFWRVLLVAAALIAWFQTQALIGRRGLPPHGISDRVHELTAPLNAALSVRPGAVNGLLIASSLFIDLLGLFLILWSIFGPSLRPLVGLMAVFLLRQICQGLTSLQPPENVLWHDPGFPSLLVTYGVSTDLFFSGHTSIAVYGATELARFKKRWLTTLAIAVVTFEIATVLILRAHYMMDVFTGIVTSLLVASCSETLARPVDHWLIAIPPREQKN